MLTGNGEIRDPIMNGGASAPGRGDLVLRIKSANHPNEDLEFQAKNSFSVKEIKETIQRLSSQHPVKEQRLIYSGHLLEDNQILKDILSAKSGSQYVPDLQQPVTIHLACTSKYINTPGRPSLKSTGQKQGGDSQMNGVGPNIQQSPMFMSQNFGVPNFDVSSGVGSTMGPNPQGVAPDFMALHNAYLEQMSAYMNQWYMYQNSMMMGGMLYQFPQPSGGMGPFGNANFVPTQPVAANNAADPAPSAPQVVPNQPQEIRPPAPAPVAPPVVARPPADDEEQQRDLLDWMYTFSRVILICSVVFFYSTFSRFILVVLFTGLVMMLQRRNNGQANNRGQPAAEVRDANNPNLAAAAAGNPPPPANPREDDGDAGENDNQREESSSSSSGSGSEEETGSENGRENNLEDPLLPSPEAPPPYTAPPPQRNIKEIAWTFLTTFFTSLIPENYHNN